MSKAKTAAATPQVEPKLLQFFAVVQQDGGYRILEVSIDVNSNKVVEAKPPTEPDVLAITFAQLQKKIRENLGL